MSTTSAKNVLGLQSASTQEHKAPATSRRPSRFWTRRARALSELTSAVAANQIVVVRGPAGVGKTTLLHQFEQDLTAAPHAAVVFVHGSVDPSTFHNAFAHLTSAPETTHIAIIDGYSESGNDQWLPEILLNALHTDEHLSIVVGTRHSTRLESPLVALDFDSHLLDPAMLRFDLAESGDVLDLNQAPWSDAALAALHEELSGWPALVQLAASRMRLERIPLHTVAEAKLLAAAALDEFAGVIVAPLPPALVHGIKLASVAPYMSAALAESIGLEESGFSSPTIMDLLQDSGLVWPSPHRLVFAEPLRIHWLRELHATGDQRVTQTQRAVAVHLDSIGEPLQAALVAAEAREWPLAAEIVARNPATAWRADPTAFARLLDDLRRSRHADPHLLSRLVLADEGTFQSAAVAELATQSEQLSRTEGAPSAHRIHLLRVAGRFGQAAELAASLVGGSHLEGDPAEALLEAGISFFEAGQVRDAAASLAAAGRAGGNDAVATEVRAFRSILLLLEGRVNDAASLLEAPVSNSGVVFRHSPWGAAFGIASAYVAVERGDAAGALALLRDLPASGRELELWPLRASVTVYAHLLQGRPTDALASLRDVDRVYRDSPASHLLLSHLAAARAHAQIALRQARRATEIFHAPFTAADPTVGAIALSILCAGRTHDAYVLSHRWETRNDLSPRAATLCLIVSGLASVRSGNPDAARRSFERAVGLTVRYGVRLPWATLNAEDRAAVASLLGEEQATVFEGQPSLFEGAVTVPRLTRREYVVLKKLGPKTTVAQLAAELVVSPNTVKTQMQSLYRKLGVSDRAAAVREAQAWGLID